MSEIKTAVQRIHKLEGGEGDSFVTLEQALTAERNELRVALAERDAKLSELHLQYISDFGQLQAQEPAAMYLRECADGSLVQLYDDLKPGTKLFVAAGATPVPIPFVTVNECGSHHYTPENVLNLVRYLRACEDGTEVIKWQDKDHKTFAGVLWRVIQALSHDVPYSAAPVPTGWQLVPVEPTHEMLLAAMNVDWSMSDTRGACIDQWQVMLAAAPKDAP